VLFLDKWQLCQKPKLWEFFKLSFGGGGGSTGVSVHLHDSQLGEGGALQGNQSIVSGTSIQFNGGTELPIEVLL